jgi:lysozyme family protein
MADFLQAVNITLVREGGYVDDPDDPGGATKYGITQRDMPGRDMKTLTIPEAIEFYKEKFWNPFYDAIVNSPIGNKLFDMGVLFGVKTTVEIMQRTLQLDDDGIFGSGTLAALNAVLTPPALLQLFKNNLVIHAVDVGAKNPRERKDVAGWINRINS